MRRVLLLIFLQFGLLAGGRLLADVVTLKDGRQISGLVESGNIQELHIKVGDQSQTIDVHEVQAIQFGISLPPPPPKAANVAPAPVPGGAAPTVKAAAPQRAVAHANAVSPNCSANAGACAATDAAGGGGADQPAQPALADSQRGRQ